MCDGLLIMTSQISNIRAVCKYRSGLIEHIYGSSTGAGWTEWAGDVASWTLYFTRQSRHTTIWKGISGVDAGGRRDSHRADSTLPVQGSTLVVRIWRL